MATVALAPRALGTPRRWATFLTGVAMLLSGIALSITAELGVGSWQVFETGVADLAGVGIGTVIVVEALVCLVLAWVWLGQRPWVATLVLAFGGIPLQAMLDALSTPSTLLARALLLALGIVLIACGVALYLASELGASAQDSLFVGFYRRYRVRPGAVRFGLDGGLVVVGALLGGQIGLGTVAVTLLVPVLIEPALRVAHHLAATPLPEALRRPLP